MRHAIRRIGATVAGALLVAACSKGAPSARATTPEDSIKGFSAKNIELTFHALDEDGRIDRLRLRAAALRHIDDQDPMVHYAALYSLALTAEDGPAAVALSTWLSSDSVDDRLLAAVALLGIGDRSGFAVLVDALTNGDKLQYRDPPQAAYEFARAALLYFTTEDLGLAAANDQAAVAATQPAWIEWLRERGNGLLWDPVTRKFS